LSNLGTDVKITTALSYASGTADRNGAVLDMAGYESALIAVHFAAIAGGAVTSIKAQQGAIANMSDAADLLGTGITVAADDDDQIFWLNILKPRERYIRVVIDKDGANAVAESAIYYQSTGRLQPEDNNVDDLVTGEVHVSPAEGTA